MPQRSSPMTTTRGARIMPGLAALLLCGSIASAQTFYGSIVGTVTDASGAVMPGARVTVTNLGTAETHSMDTTGEGLYQFVNLVPGKYRLDLEKAGFKRFTREP